MSLTKYKLGELIEIVDERNDLGIRDFYGINKSKEFMPTVANTTKLDESKYKIVRKNRFVFSGMQTGRDKSIRLVMYTKNTPIIVSPAYTTFEIKENAQVIPLYFFMIFLSEEKDRLGWFLSDSSIRANLDWEVFCDIEINLPSIEIQKKYVAIYQAMLENQEAYEEGLGDLLISYEGYFDILKKRVDILQPLKDIIIKEENSNVASIYSKKDVRGISNEKEFMKTKANLSNKDISKFLIISKDMFAYNSRTDGRDKLVLALNTKDKPILVTNNYNAFVIKDEKKKQVEPLYLYAYFNRSEFDRLVRFHSWGSSQEVLSWDFLGDIKVPIPNINMQTSLLNLYKIYLNRKEINEKLKEQIKVICPILIKGAMEEARREEV